MANKNIEETKIYQKYLDYIYYVEMILEKYPKNVKDSLVIKIRDELYSGLELILKAYKAFEKKDKLLYLNELDIKLKLLKVYSRISFKKKYINMRNYEAWGRKINHVCISLGAWINLCLKQ